MLTFAIIAVTVVLLVILALNLLFFGIFNGTNEKNYKKFEESFDKTLPEDFKRIMSKGREFSESLNWKDVYIQSYDGYRLHGSLYNVPSSKLCVLLCHGFKENGSHDFSCIIEVYVKMGFSVLIVDQRAHMKSEGRFICFGHKERYDLRDWCKYLDENLGKKIMLGGISMGTTSALLAACLPDISKNLVGVSADCGFNCMYDQFVHVAKNMLKLPTFLVTPVIWALDKMCAHRLGIDMRALRISDEISKIKVPVIFLHGGADDFVPAENTRIMYEACPTKKRLILVEEATHGMSYLHRQEECKNELLSFISEFELEKE